MCLKWKLGCTDLPSTEISLKSIQNWPLWAVTLVEPVRNATADSSNTASAGPSGGWTEAFCGCGYHVWRSRSGSGREEAVDVHLFVSTMHADEEYLEECGVAFCWDVQAISGTEVGRCEDGISPDAAAVEASSVQRREDVELAGEQVAHTQAEHRGPRPRPII